jgi:hypothetical protein
MILISKSLVSPASTVQKRFEARLWVLSQKYTSRLLGLCFQIGLHTRYQSYSWRTIKTLCGQSNMSLRASKRRSCFYMPCVGIEKHSLEPSACTPAANALAHTGMLFGAITGVNCEISIWAALAYLHRYWNYFSQRARLIIAPEILMNSQISEQRVFLTWAGAIRLDSPSFPYGSH